MKGTCTFFHRDMATARAPNSPVCPVSDLHQFSFQIFSASTLFINIFCHLFFIIIMTYQLFLIF